MKIKVSNSYSLDKRVSEITTPVGGISSRAVGTDYNERRGSILEEDDRRKYKTETSSFVNKPVAQTKVCGDGGGCNIF